MKIQIKSRFTSDILFEHDCENNSIRITLEAAVKARADLYGADLAGADLAGADLGDKEDPVEDIKQVGNIGSRGGFTVAFKCKTSIKIKCGCFFGTIDEFAEEVRKTHGNNIHGKQYAAAIEFLRKIWA